MRVRNAARTIRSPGLQCALVDLLLQNLNLVPEASTSACSLAWSPCLVANTSSKTRTSE
jgi:hypothetical protein